MLCVQRHVVCVHATLSHAASLLLPCPAGGELITDASLLEMYETGNGSVTIRAKVTIEGEGGSRGSRGGKGSKAKKPTAGGACAGVLGLVCSWWCTA
jgi:hypothetical protein